MISTGEELRRKLHFNIDKLSFDEALSLEGWLFHEDIEIANLQLAIANRRGVQRVKARLGRSRPDVFRDWGFETAARSGFGIGGAELSADGDNRLSFSIELGGASLVVELCRLALRGDRWAADEPVPNCSGCIECVAYSADRWTRQKPPRSSSLGAVLSLISHAPEAAAKLPHPVTLMTSVYRGSRYLRPFFTSLLANTGSPYSLIVVDNGNDDPAIVTYLRALAAAHDHITLLRLEENRGYIGAMCLAIDHAAPDRHVVVLNTDTVLPPNWLERLLGPVFEDPTIASTTPFTNAGTSVSFPIAGEDNPLYLGLPTEKIDALCAQVQGARCRIELPTGVGFCMAHNRAAIDRIGWYDGEAFGTYGSEEVDWCRRAERAGLRNVLVPNLFVYHKHGGIVQGEERLALQKKSHAVIQQRYPEYDADVAAYYRADPIGPLRDVLAFLLAARHGPGDTVLFFDHELGGGSYTFSRLTIEGLLSAGHRVLRVACSDRDSAVRICLLAEGVDRAFRNSALEDLSALVRFVRFDRIVVNQLAGLEAAADAVATITSLVEAIGGPLTIYMHDYFLVCPSLNLLNDENEYCGLPDLAACNRCAAANPHFRLDPAERRRFSIQAWRAAMGSLIRLAESVVCFSREAAARVTQIYEIAPEKIKITPHFTSHFKAPGHFALSPRPGVRIAVIGAIHEAKGAGIVAGLARAIRDRADPAVRLTVIGTNQSAHEWPGVTLAGQYLPEQLAEEIRRHEINLVLVPSIWPETFCYVAEEAMCLGLPLVVFDIGAPAERVRLYPRGKVLPICGGERLLDCLLRFAQEGRAAEATPTTERDANDASPPAVEGLVETIDAQRIRGWAASREEDDDHLLVEAFIDGALCGVAWTDAARSEAAAATGRHGFAIDLGSPIKSAELSRLEVYVTAGSGRRARLRQAA